VTSLQLMVFHRVKCVELYVSCFRETGSMEQHAEALVSLLESCLNHNLRPSHKDEDPPHAKISSDIISCIFLVSCNFHNNGINSSVL